ncbi:hypothetical protein Ancab_035537, partial [Ancistrocladus abbreviatus]
MLENSLEMKVINKPSYVDVVRHKASNKEGMSQTFHPQQMGSHKKSRDFPDRPFVSLDIDGANLEKGLEERVGLANLINDNSSFFAKATASGDINPEPCPGEMGSSSGNKGKGVGGPKVGPGVGCDREVEAEEGGDCGPCELQSMGWAGL